jgi:hypothetical protein
MRKRIKEELISLWKECYVSIVKGGIIIKYGLSFFFGKQNGALAPFLRIKNIKINKKVRVCSCKFW